MKAARVWDRLNERERKVLRLVAAGDRYGWAPTAWHTHEALGEKGLMAGAREVTPFGREVAECGGEL